MYPKLKPIAAALAVLSVCPTPSLAADKDADPIVVTATRQDQKLSEALFDLNVIGRKEIQNSTAQSVGELLGNQAGLQMNRAGSPGSGESIYIRGMGSNQSLILIDGVRVSSATLGTTALELVPLNQINRIEVVKGPASAIYGSDAMGGVINIITDQFKEGSEYAAGFGSQKTFSANAAKAFGLGDFRFYFKGGIKGSEGINSISESTGSGSVYNPDKDGYNSSNFAFGAKYAPGTTFSLAANYLSLTSNTRFDSNQYNPNTYGYSAKERSYSALNQIEKFSLIGQFALSDVWKTTATLARSTDASKNNLVTTTGSPPSRFITTQDQFSLQNDIQLPIGTALLVLESLEQRIGGTQSYAERSRNISSLSAGWHGDFGAHSLQANARTDQNSQYGSHDTYTVGYGYRITPSVQLSAITGTSFRAPTFNDLYYPNDGSGEGNPNLKPETARNHEVALKYAGQEISAKLAYYQHDVSNMIAWAPTSNPYFWTPSNIGKAQVEGWETELSTKIAGWNLAANFNLQNPVAKSDSPSGDVITGNPLRRQPKEFGALRANRQFGVLNFAAEITGRGGINEYGYDYTNSKQVVMPMGGYTILNLHADWSPRKDTNLFVNFGNVFDRKYETAKSTTTQYNTLGATIFVGIRYTPQ